MTLSASTPAWSLETQSAGTTGPYSADQIREMLREKQIEPSTRATAEHLKGEWITVQELLEAFTAAEQRERSSGATQPKFQPPSRPPQLEETSPAPTTEPSLSTDLARGLFDTLLVAREKKSGGAKLKVPSPPPRRNASTTHPVERLENWLETLRTQTLPSLTQWARKNRKLLIGCLATLIILLGTKMILSRSTHSPETSETASAVSPPIPRHEAPALPPPSIPPAAVRSRPIEPAYTPAPIHREEPPPPRPSDEIRESSAAEQEPVAPPPPINEGFSPLTPPPQQDQAVPAPESTPLFVE
jgi:hypothetical protein